MDVYIKITKTEGLGELKFRFGRSDNPNLWYGDGETIYTDIEDELIYEAKYISSTADLSSYDLDIHDIDSGDKIYTLTVNGESISNSPTFNTSVTAVDLGVGEIIDELVQTTGSIINAEWLIGDILISGNTDDSFSFSTDSTNWYKEEIPLESIVFIGTTFELFIKRNYTIFAGANVTPLTFINSGLSFTIDVSSSFTIQQQTGGGGTIWEVGTGTESIQSITTISNDASGDYSVIVGGVGNTITNGGTKSFIGGGNLNNISNTYSAIIAGSSNNITSMYSTISGGAGNTITSSYSHCSGYLNEVTGIASHAEGTSTKANGWYSHAQNNRTTADGVASHSQGYYTTATGLYSHVGGYGNSTYRVIASGDGSFNHSQQQSTTTQYEASGDYSAILGGRNNNITSVGDRSIIIGGNLNNITNYESAIIGGTSHTLSGLRSVILGGSSITATSNNMVYVPSLNIDTTPTTTTDTTPTFLTRNETTGVIEKYQKTIYTKEMDIGDWNMDTTISVSTSLGTITPQNIYSINVMIRNDANNQFNPLDSVMGVAGVGGAVYINGTTLYLSRTTSGPFDNTNYNSTSYNRGKIIIHYSL